jgi:exopolysaccharide production protein ExoY
MSIDYRANETAAESIILADIAPHDGPGAGIVTAAATAEPLGGWAKRATDVVVASLALVWFAPLFLFIAVLLKLSDRGPVLLQQKRLGDRVPRFGCLKFRTMVVDADEALARYLRANPEAAREWADTRKLRHDPRVTAFGAFLRRSSLDELPQLINVLRGDMSIVGPRPVVTDELKLYGPDAGYYLRTRPGLTGAWQISGRNDLSYEGRVALDRDYVTNWSLTRDAIIILKTIPAVLSTKGSY